MRILISGAGGFIGRHLARTAAERKIDIVALARVPDAVPPPARMVCWSFGAALPPDARAGIDCAVHLAHDFGGEEGARGTVAGTLALVDELRRSGTGRQLFCSSFSAGEHARSLYGRTKLEIEQRLREAADVIIVRPGLVIGDGGIYARIRKWAVKLPVVPLPDGGYGEVPVIGVGILCDRLLDIAQAASPPREANLWEGGHKSLRTLVLEAAAAAGRKPWILPVPGVLLMRGLAVAQALRLPLPVTADNIVGFLANQGARHVSTLDG